MFIYFTGYIYSFWLDGFRIWYNLGLITAAVTVALSQPLQSHRRNLSYHKETICDWRQIEINGKSGEVSDITILYTTLLEIDTSKSSGQFTGKLLQIQNRHLFTSTIVNFSAMFGMTWEEISFTITYESNWKKRSVS